MEEKRGRTRALGYAERAQCAAMIRDLLTDKRDPSGRKWTLRSLAMELGVSQEAVRKAQDPDRVGPKVARGLREAFGAEVSLPEDSPAQMLRKVTERLTGLDVPDADGVALHLALEGDLKDGLSETWRIRLRTVADALIDDGIPKPQAYRALAECLIDVGAMADSLDIYRAASRHVVPRKQPLPKPKK